MVIVLFLRQLAPASRQYPCVFFEIKLHQLDPSILTVEHPNFWGV